MSSTVKHVQRTPLWRGVTAIAGCGLAAAIGAAAVAGCGSGSSGGAAASAPAGGGGGSSKHVNIAMFLVATDNTHQQASAKGAQAAVAQMGNATLHVFNGNFQPQTQLNQVEAATASGQYNALLIDSVDGSTVVPAIDKAVGSGIKVVCGFSICGPNQLAFQKELPGVVAQIGANYVTVGAAAADAIGKACGSTNPCKTVYMDGTPTLAADVTFTKGFTAEIKKYPNVKIVATGAGQFTAAGGYTAMKNIIQAHPDINAVGSVSDQEITGVAQALAGSALKDKRIILVGDGGSRLAVRGLKAGVWYGSAILRPYHEGYLEATAAIKAVRGQAVGPTLVNSALTPQFPSGYVSRSDATNWQPEWAG
jgi:ribose transport system substrate-binding protein